MCVKHSYIFVEFHLVGQNELQLILFPCNKFNFPLLITMSRNNALFYGVTTRSLVDR
jgi:hypothetical protein